MCSVSSVMSDSLWPHRLHPTRLLCPGDSSGKNTGVSCHLVWGTRGSLSIINSWSLLKLMSIKSVMPSRHLILCPPFLLLPQSLPASGSFPKSQFFTSGGHSIGDSGSASVLPMNTQDWSPLGWTAWISLQSKGIARVFSSTTVQKHQFFGPQLSS